jgi:hypothetical protein
MHFSVLLLLTRIGSVGDSMEDPCCVTQRP